MTSYNRLNGTFLTENTRLLDEVLKREWGFDGMVMSDWGAVHTTVDAANAGLDLEMPGPARYYGDMLVRPSATRRSTCCSSTTTSGASCAHCSERA